MFHPDVAAAIEYILSSLGDQVPPPFFRYCLKHARKPLTVDAVARALGIRRRALEYRHRRLGLLPPGATIAWCRLLLAIDQLEGGRDSVEQVALQHGYPSADALRKTIRRLLRRQPHLLRESSSFASAVLRFIKALRREPPLAARNASRR